VVEINSKELEEALFVVVVVDNCFEACFDPRRKIVRNLGHP